MDTTERERVLKELLWDIGRMPVHQSRAGGARKKQLLLLLILSRIQNRQVHENRIYFEDVESALTRLIHKFGGRPVKAAQPQQPFYFLKSSKFWHLRTPGDFHHSLKPNECIPIARLRKRDIYAQFDVKVFALLLEDRDALLKVVVKLLASWPDAKEREDLARELALSESIGHQKLIP